MLDMFTGFARNCEGLHRRAFLKIGSLGGLGITLPFLLKHKQGFAKEGKSAKGTNCIFIWTQGGTSHHDTLDPKPQAPVNVKGPFGVIDTAVSGVKFSEVCPRLAQEANRFSVLRSWNPKNGSHGFADQYCMSGRFPNQALTYPCTGSVVSHQQGFKSALPPFVQLGNHVDRTFNGGTAGFLGLEHSPFEIHAEANVDKFNVRDITPPLNMDSARVGRRKSVLSAIDVLQKRAELQPKAYDALDEHYKAALNMITAPETKKAFDIGSEDPKLRDRYGRTPLGQRMLLSRRLIEAGVRFVTVSDPAWDNHQDCFNALKNSRMPPVDQALPELLIDLEQHGLLESTLVVWMTDFGRTPKINSASGRDHWASAGFVMMAGAGVPGGLVIGATDDEGSAPTRSEYHTEQVVATIYAKLGLPLDLTVTASDGRPIRLIEGDPIREWA
ncbi:MAG TPA: DUF1501 domain-containing protein [Planctomycetaceae bacterium]|nr:DUF1501 domain-containing protein [Planctomycetaceae bacterium]